MRALGVLLLAGVGIAGCAPNNDELRAKLESRAKFDLECPKLDLKPLEETSLVVTSYGVIGCGRRVTYILNAATSSWVMNAEGGRPVGAVTGEQPPPPPPPPPPQH